jgi:hypothetical protein
MKRLFDNLHVDLIAAGLMIGMIATGYILRFPLPPGSNKSLSLWGFTRHQWGSLHFWISLGLLAVVLLHLALHWHWIVITVKRRLPGTTSASPGLPCVSGLMTFLGLAAVLVVFGWVVQSSVTTITEPREDVCPPTDPDSGKKPPSAVGSMPEESQPAFWSDVYPVLERSCLSCHGPKKQSGGFRVDRREDFFGKNGVPPLVVPGKSAASPLIAIVSGQRKDIPRPDVHRLSDEHITLLRAWIDAGASWPERPAQK